MRKNIALSLCLLVASICLLNYASAETYDVSSLSLELKGGSPADVTSEEIMSEEYSLGQISSSVLSSRDSGELVSFTLSSLPGSKVTSEGLVDLQNQIVKYINGKGYYGIVVIPSPEQIDPRTGRDRRNGTTSLEFDIWFSEVTDTRTVAKGVRVDENGAINNSVHAFILEKSPIGPGVAEGSTTLNRNILDEYLDRLNSLPTRRVDVALSSSGKPGKVILDYLVNEAKPWLVYAQLSNTGTDSTGMWRERFGGIYNQLTGHDDILTVDFITANFDQANALAASYEIPVMLPNYLSARVYGSYADFSAENLLITGQPDFTGTTTVFGAEVIGIPAYFMNHAFSVTGGFRSEDIEVENILGTSTGNAKLSVPYISLGLTKNKQYHKSNFSLTWEANSKGIDQIFNLGRLDTVADYSLMKYQINQSFFIDYLLNRDRKIGEGDWISNQLVHELSFSLSGQMTLGSERLIPQVQQYVGGFFTVRGYPESTVAGDDAFVFSSEYRWHITRGLKPYSLFPESEKPTRTFGDTFNARAPDPFTRADWDWTVRFFVDYASTSLNNKRQDEADNKLMSIGTGVDLKIKDRFSIRLDLGYALKDAFHRDPTPADRVILSGSDVDARDLIMQQIYVDDARKGDFRAHILMTYSF